VQAGYHVETVDFSRKTVTFQKFHAEYKIERVDDAILWNKAAIRALRKHMGLTQEKFAQELGVRRQTVSEWENGVYEPDRSTAKHLALISQQRQFEG
jgi:DNA-binding transcriptional regulator YiaG